MAEDWYHLEGETIENKDGVIIRQADGTLASSVSSLWDVGVWPSRAAAESSLSPGDAIEAVCLSTRVPHRAFVPITIGAPDGYPSGHFAAGGEPYGMTYNAADPGDAAKIAAALADEG